MRYLMTPLGARVLLVVFAALLTSPLSLAAGATEYDGKYTGLISCDVVPGLTTRRLRTDFLLKIIDGQAQYEREVLRADTTIPAGVAERGTGTVSARGEVSLTGSAATQGWSYEATYRGQVTGKSLRLSGAQQWRLQGSGTAHTRPCTITLSRSE